MREVRDALSIIVFYVVLAIPWKAAFGISEKKRVVWVGFWIISIQNLIISGNKHPHSILPGI
jgi:hypothetical protein